MADQRTQGLMVNLNGQHAFRFGTLVFYHDASFVDAVIRLGEDGYFSHVGFALGDGRMISALEGKGVGYSADFVQISDIEARPLPNGIDPNMFAHLLSMELGRPYDFPRGWLAVAAYRWLGIRWGGGPPATFTCSSLIAYVLKECGAWRSIEPLRDVSPQDIWSRVNT